MVSCIELKMQVSSFVKEIISLISQFTVIMANSHVNI
jgi:hypothetical protein